jgi:hypothetical protein
VLFAICVIRDLYVDQPIKVMKRLGIAVPSTLSAAGSIRSNFHIADEGDQVRRGGGWGGGGSEKEGERGYGWRRGAGRGRCWGYEGMGRVAVEGGSLYSSMLAIRAGD